MNIDKPSNLGAPNFSGRPGRPISSISIHEEQAMKQLVVVSLSNEALKQLAHFAPWQQLLEERCVSCDFLRQEVVFCGGLKLTFCSYNIRECTRYI
jgi:hypothetical protein